MSGRVSPLNSVRATRWWCSRIERATARSARRIAAWSGKRWNCPPPPCAQSLRRHLAFIYTYSHMFRRLPAETDMQRHFQVTPPSVHQMIWRLEAQPAFIGVNPVSPEAS